MSSYARVKYSVEIAEIIKNNPDYFGNKFLADLSERSAKSFLVEMNEVYLLEKPFFEKYAFIGLFKMNPVSWERQSANLTQLGLYNTFRNMMVSTPAYYNGQLKEKILNFKEKEIKHELIENYYDDEFESISKMEYMERQENNRMSYKLTDLNHAGRSNLTTKNINSTSKEREPYIDTIQMLKIIQDLLSEGISAEELNDSIKTTLKIMDDKLEIFEEDENNGYSVENQWCVRVCGAIEGGTSYARWFKSKMEANVFMKKLLRDRSMSIVQSEMICLMS